MGINIYGVWEALKRGVSTRNDPNFTPLAFPPESFDSCYLNFVLNEKFLISFVGFLCNFFVPFSVSVAHDVGTEV